MVSLGHPLDQVQGLQPAEADQRVGMDQLRIIWVSRNDVLNDETGDNTKRTIPKGQQVIEDYS